MAKNINLIAAICPQCGAKLNINKELDRGMCNYCGTEIIIKDIIQNIKIEESLNTTNLLKLAEREFNDQNYEEALKFYEKILEREPDNHASVFYRGVCLTSITSITEFRIDYLIEGLNNAIEIVLKSKSISEKKDKIIIDYAYDVLSTLIEIYHTSLRYYQEYDNLKYSIDDLRYRLDKCLESVKILIKIFSTKIKSSKITSKSDENKDELLKTSYNLAILICVELCKKRKYDDINGAKKTSENNKYKEYLELYDIYVKEVKKINKDEKIPRIYRKPLDLVKKIINERK